MTRTGSAVARSLTIRERRPILRTATAPAASPSPAMSRSRTAGSPPSAAVPPTECPEIDAAGLCVAPGFIDIHSHSDYTLLVDPRAVSAIHQGVTLEVVGNCGFGCFPIRDPELARKAIYGYSDEVPIEWTTAGGYFDRLEAARARR